MVAGLASKATPQTAFQNPSLLHIFTPHRLCAKYNFKKPNDRAALDLMNAAAKAVVTELPDITIAYGVSDEYRYFLFIVWCLSRSLLADRRQLCPTQDMYAVRQESEVGLTPCRF
jgi:hypothetical protein